MTADEFRDAIDQLGLKQTGPHGVTALVDVAERTARRWASGEIPVPRSVELLFVLMLEKGLTPEDVIDIYKAWKRGRRR